MLAASRLAVWVALQKGSQIKLPAGSGSCGHGIRLLHSRRVQHLTNLEIGARYSLVNSNGTFAFVQITRTFGIVSLGILDNSGCDKC